jgi:hypothetical protein
VPFAERSEKTSKSQTPIMVCYCNVLCVNGLKMATRTQSPSKVSE